jgi:oligosaccharyltransferase complex subunit delta (ribophorin II)
MIVSLFFTAIVLATVPALFIAWLTLGANINHISRALSGAPISHVLYFGSIVAMEVVFYMYYSSWTLFQTLPVALGVGLVTFLSGSKALSEVYERRVAGTR